MRIVPVLASCVLAACAQAPLRGTAATDEKPRICPIREVDPDDRVLDPARPHLVDLTCEYDESVLKRDEKNASKPGRFPLPYRCHVLVRQALVSELVVALAEATEFQFAALGAIADRRLTLAAENTTVDELARLLATRGVGLRVNASGAEFFEREGFFSQTKMKLIRLSGNVSPAQIADAVCRVAVSWQGSLSVVGATLVVNDTEEQLARIEELVRELDAAPPSVEPARPASLEQAPPESTSATWRD